MCGLCTYFLFALLKFCCIFDLCACVKLALKILVHHCGAMLLFLFFIFIFCRVFLICICFLIIAHHDLRGQGVETYLGTVIVFSHFLILNFLFSLRFLLHVFVLLVDNSEAHGVTTPYCHLHQLTYINIIVPPHPILGGISSNDVRLTKELSVVVISNFFCSKVPAFQPKCFRM